MWFLKFLRLVFGKNGTYMRWLWQASRGENRVRIGQKWDGRDWVFCVQFAKRGKYGVWEELAKFPYLDSVDFMGLLTETSKKIGASTTVRV